MASIHEKHDWKKIQSEYDSGKTTDEVRAIFSISTRGIRWGTLNGKLKTRERSLRTKMAQEKNPQRHSEETKKKLSEIRIKYLKENPDKVPYLINHSSNKSWPEKIFEGALIKSKIVGWESRYRNGIYQYDIAFPKQKIDVEIDGGTHKTEKVMKIDARRDAWSISEGWTVIRFPAERVKKNLDECILELNSILRKSSHRGRAAAF